MKFIRLTTDNPNAIFNADFNDGIEIPANAKIALQSASGNVRGGVLEITDANNNIDYQIEDSFSRQVHLSPQLYTNANSDKFLQDISDTLNDDAIYSVGYNKIIGLEWNTAIDTAGLVNIAYRITSANQYFGTGLPEFDNAWSKKNADGGNVGGGEYRFSQNIGRPMTTTFTNGLINNIPISKGNGILRVRINNIADGGVNASNGMYIALTKSPVEMEDFEEKLIHYGIRVGVDHASGAIQYSTVINGVATLSAVTPSAMVSGSTNNDILALEVDGNKVHFYVYREADGGIPQNLLGTTSATYEANTDLYPVMIFQPTSVNGSWIDLLWTPSAWNIPNYSEALTQRTSTNTHATAPPVNDDPVPTTLNFLQFQSSVVSDFLGYASTRLPPSGFISAKKICIYLADQIYSVGLSVNPYIIQLLNLKLDSYDSFKNQRENILAVIPNNDANGNVAYSPPTPFFIDLMNKEAIIVRNIKARIVNTDYSEPILEGTALLNLLITS